MVSAAVRAPLHIDALRELCNICGGRAADALSRLLGERPVGLDLAEAGLAHLEVTTRLGGPDAPVVAARVELAGPVRGELWLVLAEPDAALLSGLLDARVGRQLAPSALYEAANIVASACLNALYSLTRFTVVPSVPEVFHGTVADVLARLGRSAGNGPVLTTELALRDRPVRGRILFLPHEDSVEPILQAMGVH
jgi:chemotaxis protein CheC